MLRMEQQLRESEARLRSIIESAPEAIVTIDHTSRITEFNPAAETMFGWKREQVLGRDAGETLIPPALRAAHRQALQNHLQSPTARRARARMELAALRADGSEFMMELTVARLAGEPPQFTAFTRDLTAELKASEQQRRAAMELRRSEARFRALTQLSADWFWEQDANFRFVDVSAGGNWPAGLPPAPQILGKTRWELGDLEMDDWQAHRAMLERHEPFRDVEVRRRTADGQLRLIAISGSPVFDDEGRFTGYRGVGREITEQRRSQEALRESQRMLAALLANLPGMAYRCRNAPQWPLEFVSEGALALTGYAPAAFLGGAVRYDDVIHPEDRAMVWDAVQEAVAQRRRFQITYRIVTAHGQLKWVWEQGAAAGGDASDTVALEGLVLDVTERRQAQEEIARLNVELEQRVRQRTEQLQAANAELEAFSYSIAHDLRSPLTSIDGFSHVLAGYGAQLDERARHYLQRIRSGVQQMSELTDALLALAHLSRVNLRREQVDLAEAARVTLAQLREREPLRELQAEIPGHLWAMGDPRLLAQVVANLVGNAWKFSARKPRTVLRLGSARGGSGETVYFVADQGAGFDMAHASRLFGAFQRLHAPSEFDGTGIGLALVQKIVQRHGGRIWAEAQPGRGATFYFTLGSMEPD